jgi:predicted secreted protein
MRAGGYTPVLVPSVACRSSAPASVRPASALVCTALGAALVALGMFAFLTLGVPREVFWVVLVQLTIGSRTVREAGQVLAAIVTSRGCHE